jgi:hypothetical protein
MCVYVCIYYVCVYVCIYVCMCVCVCLGVCTVHIYGYYECVFVCVCMYVCMYVCMCVCTYAYKCSCIYMCVSVFMCYLCGLMCIYVWMCVLLCFLCMYTLYVSVYMCTYMYAMCVHIMCSSDLKTCELACHSKISHKESSIFRIIYFTQRLAGSSVDIATAYRLVGPGIESLWGEIFRTCPGRLWGPPSLLYNGCQIFPGGKVRPGCDADPSPASSAEVKNWVELYLYSP